MSKDQIENLEYAASPLNKSEETKLMEQIISALISDTYQDSAKKYDELRKKRPDLKSHIAKKITAVESSYQQKVILLVDNNQLFAQLDYDKNVRVNITELIKKVNFTHISLSDADLAKYEDFYDNDSEIRLSIPNPEQFREKIAAADLTQREYLPQLTYAEQLAVHKYTSVNYEDMNNMLRGSAIPDDVAEISQALIDIAIASQGLNKVPDIELPTVIRFQDEYGLENMKKLAAQGGVEQVPGFISTAHQPQKRFGEVQIIFKNTKGKSISALSKMSEEEEYLIPPTTQIRFIGYEFKDGRHIFTAEGANVLLDQEYSKENKAAQAARGKIDADIEQIHNQLSSRATPAIQHLSAEQLNLIAPTKNPIAHPNYIKQSNSLPIEQPHYTPDLNYKGPFNNNAPVKQPHYTPESPPLPVEQSPQLQNLPSYFFETPEHLKPLQPASSEQPLLQTAKENQNVGATHKTATEQQPSPQNTNKMVRDFLEKSVKTLYTCGVITLSILEKYINNELPKDAQPDKKLESLLVKDRLVLCINKLADKLGLKSISEKLKNQISPEGKKIIDEIHTNNNVSKENTFAEKIKGQEVNKASGVSVGR